LRDEKNRGLWLRKFAQEEARRLGKVEREVALSEVSDLSILKEAQREMGIAGR
jgi:hypothetical protein